MTNAALLSSAVSNMPGAGIQRRGSRIVATFVPTTGPRPVPRAPRSEPKVEEAVEAAPAASPATAPSVTAVQKSAPKPTRKSVTIEEVQGAFAAASNWEATMYQLLNRVYTDPRQSETDRPILLHAIMREAIGDAFTANNWEGAALALIRAMGANPWLRNAPHRKGLFRAIADQVETAHRRGATCLLEIEAANEQAAEWIAKRIPQLRERTPMEARPPRPKPSHPQIPARQAPQRNFQPARRTEGLKIAEDVLPKLKQEVRQARFDLELEGVVTDDNLRPFTDTEREEAEARLKGAEGALQAELDRRATAAERRRITHSQRIRAKAEAKEAAAKKDSKKKGGGKKGGGKGKKR